VLDVRVYRAAFVPAVLAMFVVAFSLQGRPSPLRTRSVADAFDPARAYGGERVRDSLLQLGAAFPERRPGAAGDAALADRVADVFRAAGLGVTRTREQGRTVDGETELETVVGIRPGLSSRRIVVLAHRDSLASPGLAELSGTAALLELARIFRTRAPSAERDADEPGTPQLIGRDLRKTLVLVSTSGGSGGGAGARAWARRQDAAAIDGVLLLGDLASAEWHKPWVVPWSNGEQQPPLGWQRTVEVAARQEVGADPGGARASAQWSRRALPLAITEQGEVNRAGLPAVLLQVSGERGPARGAAVSPARFTQLGRSALRSVIALDEAGPRGSGGDEAAPFEGESHGIVTLRNVLPDWSVRLMVLCLLLPALLAALDSFFRARRRRLRTGAWFAWTLAAGSPCRSRGCGCACSASRAPCRRRPAPCRRRRCGSTAPRPARWRRSRSRSSRACCSCGRSRAGPARRAATRPPAPPVRRSARPSARSRSPSGCSIPTRPPCCCPPRTCGSCSECRRRACAAGSGGSRSPPA